MPKFHHIYIEISNVCQFNCSFCPKTSRAQAFMNLEQFEEILKKISGYTNLIYLHVLGEPLIHPLLDDILRLSQAYQMSVNITSNGYNINNVSELLLKYDHLNKINFSLHSIEDENQLSLSSSAYLANIYDFTKQMLAKDTTSITYRLWDTNKNDDLVMDFLRANFPLIDFKHTKSQQNGIRLAYRLFLSQDNLFEWPVNASDKEQTAGYCLGLKSHIAILVNGDVIPCCLDSEGQLVLGNIFNQSLAEILNSKRATAIKLGFQRHQVIEKLCQNCTYKERFDK